MKPFITVNGTGYVLTKNITKFFNDVFKANVTKGETEYVLARMKVPYETIFVYVINNYARCYKVVDIENLVRYRKSEVRDSISLSRVKHDFKPAEIVHDTRTEDEIRRDDEIERRRRLAKQEKDPVPPEEDMETVSRELLRNQEVFY